MCTGDEFPDTGVESEWTSERESQKATWEPICESPEEIIQI